MPCSVSSLAVPPVERILILNRASPRASSASPVLSDTLTSAVRTGTFMRAESSEYRVENRRKHDERPSCLTLNALHLDFERLDFLPQGIAVDAQHFRGNRLVACGSIQDNFQHRPLDVLDHHVVDGARLCPVEVLEVPLQRPADAIRDLACLLHFPLP